MKYDCVKTENCFADSQTYEYKLPLNGGEFSARLGGWDLRRNERLRRPVFTADRDGVNVKGVLEYNTVKASFPAEGWEAKKAEFDKWLEALE